MKSFFSLVLFIILAALLQSCAGSQKSYPESLPINRGKLPPSDISLSIPGLGPCTEGTDRTLLFNSQQPVTILVHGCRGSAGRFRALAEVFAFHGQQTACFSYNDRDSLVVSATQLTKAVDTLSAKMQSNEMTIIGHSQGGLLARKALVSELPEPLQNADLQLHLVTISAPFAGISASSHCGSSLARILSLGLTVPICKIISGDKWHEITEYSDFIRQPGELITQVGEYLKIATAEAGSCRQSDADGACVEDDFVFSLAEQYYPPVDSAVGVTNLEIKAGHVEIVGDDKNIPFKLISVLQKQQILAPTSSKQQAAFQNLLTLLYKEK